MKQQISCTAQRMLPGRWVVGRFRALAIIVHLVQTLVMSTPLKIVVEKHSDGYVAYPLGLARGVVVGQGDNYESALADVRSAIAFHLETFGPGVLAAQKQSPNTY